MSSFYVNLGSTCLRIMFKIVSVGWQCAQFLERTLLTVSAQTRGDFEIMITYDPSTDDGAQMILDWCAERDERWRYQINGSQHWAVRNQYEAIIDLDPADDDIIVFLDLDGDQLAHPEVLERLAEAYSDGTLLTYGNNQHSKAVPYPAEVVRGRTYRQHILDGRGCCFNHVRCMKGKVFRAIPPNYFKWSSSSPRHGEWLPAGTDYVFMVSGLELVNGRYKCLEETLLIYNAENPLADNVTHPGDTHLAVMDFLNRPPLAPMEGCETQ